jgi:hypothetical protein
MTVEVGMLNKQGVALAADSAVTSTINGKQKVYNSANKVFMLSATAPIGIMIYGSASYMGIPWETIIKLYRKNLGSKTFDTTHKYASDFLEYLEKSINITEVAKRKFYNGKAYRLIDELVQSMNEFTQDAFLAKINEYSKIIDDSYNIPKSFESIDLSSDKDTVVQTFKNFLEYNDINIEWDNEVEENIFSLFTKFLTCDYMPNISGIVIAGFGELEYFPSLFSYQVEGLIEGVIKKLKVDEVLISDENEATIVPFAQTGMINTFLQGVNPDLLSHSKKELDNTIHSLLQGIKEEVVKASEGVNEAELEKNLVSIGEQVIYDYMQNLDEYKRKNHIIPILDTIEMLGKEDLAAMAESLVNITSMEKKMSMNIESVGGPIDVAVISKGDGFIWYKRKHYFDISYNPHFPINK